MHHHETPAPADSNTRLAIAATLHCLSGCAIGEISGMIIGGALNLPNAATIALAVALAFFFGYLLSLLPLLRHGVDVKKAMLTVLAADTLSIAAMEIADNAVMAAVPGAMNADLVNPIFWATMPVALLAGFLVALPVNRALLARGKGHALVHQSLHHGHDHHGGALSMVNKPLVAGIAGFLLGGLLISIAATTYDKPADTAAGHAASYESASY